MTDRRFAIKRARDFSERAVEEILAGLGAGTEITGPLVRFVICQRCGRPLMLGQPYMPRIPMRTSHRGFDHQFCPPQLVRSTE